MTDIAGIVIKHIIVSHSYCDAISVEMHLEMLLSTNVPAPKLIETNARPRRSGLA